jgi:hypothetical protein
LLPRAGGLFHPLNPPKRSFGPPLHRKGESGEDRRSVPAGSSEVRSGANSPGRLEGLALIVILLLAAGLRMGAPGISEFKRDEANLSQLALDLARGRSFPLLGIGSSVGLPNAPVSVYLFTVPFFLGGDPTLATLFVGLLNVVGVGMTWALARRYYGPVAALVAALFYAVSPWGVIFSRKIWAQDLLPPFVIAALASGLLGFIEGKRWAQFVHLPLLALTLQIHYGAFVLVPLTVLMIVFGRRRLTRAFAWSVAPLIALALPFAAGLIQAGFAHPEQVARVLSSGSSPHAITVSGDAIHLAALTVAGTEIHSLAGPAAFQQYLASVPDAYPVFNLIAWAVLLSGVWLAIRSLRCRDARAPVDWVFLAWLAIPPLAFTVTWTAPFPHYMIPMMPAAYIVLGAGVAWVLGLPHPELASPPAPLHQSGEGGQSALSCAQTMTKVLRLITVAVIVAVAALQVWLTVSLLGFLDTHDTPGGFGTPLHVLLDVRSAILKEQPYDVLVIGEGDTPPYDETSTVWRALLDGLASVRFVNATRMFVVPDHAALYVGSAQYQDVIGQHLAGTPRLFPTRPGADPLAIWRLSENSGRNAKLLDSAVNVTNGRLANGATLRQVQFIERGDELTIRAWWRIERLARDPDVLFSVFNHIVDGDGKKWGQIDGPFWLGRYWRQGDSIVQAYNVTLGDGHPSLAQLSLRTGMYTYDGTRFYGIDVLETNGTATGQTITVPIR